MNAHRSLLPLVCAAASLCALVPANSARAKAAVSMPFSSSVCLTPADVVAALELPTNFYPLGAQCVALCKKAANDCKQYVRAAAGCRKSELGDTVGYAEKNCDFSQPTDAAARKLCKTNAKLFGATQQATGNEARDTALDTCGTWGDDCASSCSGF